ncbi:TPA: hypothetical protein QCY18_005776 [Bacillus cereus]|uniref:hypothetical protein n=1 Tax=Bacillus TaxID=1386 RepID=UPI000A302B4A|nr:hypothetical protein [Bacillus cereus]MED2682875.1 hypothetical protein [Bacillus thuringiensis]EKS7861231.1 hypothetical protein [Bacillus cereus]MBL3742549.1 hypothetical protein [Bacillus cereus]MBL3865134.1 hypothetical protein [Bacillus cereus]MBR9665533.1 hypothetical protein [Bacillus cereus]
MKPKYFSIAMYPTVSFKQEEILGRLLDVFESNEKFAPTHWGSCETIQVEYNREEILEKVISEGRVSEVHLYRDKSVNYRGSFEVNLSHGSFLEFEFHKSISKSLWSAFFELSDQIAEIVKPSYGLAHMFWSVSYPWNTERERLHKWMNMCAQPIPVRFLPSGPLGIGTRTYFSSHVLDMFDKELLVNSPAVVSELNWGGVCIDLLQNSLEVDIDTLLDSWLHVMKYLEPAQVMAIPSFGDNGRGVFFSPNVAWKDHLKG